VRAERPAYDPAGSRPGARIVLGNERDVNPRRQVESCARERRRELRSIDGIGEYASGSLLKLLGRYDRLALDSWCRGKWASLNGKKRVPDRTIERATDGVTFSGLEHLQQGRAYLFLANHRDIVMDPAFVNYAVYQAGIRTPRIAIGDNLLQRPFVSDLMRLNKSFIVRRSITGRREKLAAYQVLSAYINHSIRNDGESVWIAQAEGRAKDGDDRTDSAILKMLHMSRKDEAFAEALEALRPVPVSISYEYDPCDQAKARELYIRATTGTYSKAPGEDDTSIALGITGYKGRVHIAFGSPMESVPDDAKQMAIAVDRQILGSYRLFPVHYLAYRLWDEQDPEIKVPSAAELFSREEIERAEAEWSKRLAACPSVQQPYLIQQYATPVRNQYRLLAGLEP